LRIAPFFCRPLDRKIDRRKGAKNAKVQMKTLTLTDRISRAARVEKKSCTFRLSTGHRADFHLRARRDAALCSWSPVRKPFAKRAVLLIERS
jgi:hypothetical protein